MFEKIDHLGIAVKSIEEASKFYTSLGMKIDHIEVVEEQKVRVAMINIGGVNIELLEPTSPESPIAKSIEKKGEGIHHISYKVPDIRAALATLKEQGVPLINEEPRVGAHNMLIAFVHPKGVNGVLTELSQAQDNDH